MQPEQIPTALRTFAPEYALVLGSGLASVAESIEPAGTLGFDGVPDLPRPRVPGHTGRFLWGTIAGSRVLIAQGRVHLYEGHSAHEVTAGIRFMAAAGVKKLILTNAAGTLRETNPPGSWMLISDHLNLTGTSPLLGAPDFISMEDAYSRVLRERFHAATKSVALPLCEGVYAGVLGPQYETPAEIRMLRAMGADAVGMSTVLEAIQARALGLEVAALSCLTNWAAGLSPAPLSHEEVLRTGREASGSFLRLLTAFFSQAA